MSGQGASPGKRAPRMSITVASEPEPRRATSTAGGVKVENTAVELVTIPPLQQKENDHTSDRTPVKVVVVGDSTPTSDGSPASTSSKSDPTDTVDIVGSEPSSGSASSETTSATPAGHAAHRTPGVEEGQRPMAMSLPLPRQNSDFLTTHSPGLGPPGAMGRGGPPIRRGRRSGIIGGRFEKAMEVRRKSVIDTLAKVHDHFYQQSKTRDNRMYFAARNNFEESLRFWADMALISAMFGILCMIVENEITWNHPDILYARDIMKAIVSASTIALWFFLFKIYAVEWSLLKLRGLVPPDSSPWHHRDIVISFMAEIFVCGLHIPPGVDGTIIGDALSVTSKQVVVPLSALGTVMFLRVYLFVRVLKFHSRWHSSSARFIGALGQVEFSASFVVKSLAQSKPFITLSFVITMLVLSMSYALYAIERESHSKNMDFIDSMWLILVTMSTVGFGDLVPENQVGRIISVLGAVTGVISTALLVAFLSEKLRLTRAETRVVHMMNKQGVRHTIRNLAAEVIQGVWRYYKHSHNERQKAYHRQMFFKKIRKYRDTKRGERDALEVLTSRDTVLQDILIKISTIENVVKRGDGSNSGSSSNGDDDDDKSKSKATRSWVKAHSSPDRRPSDDDPGHSASGVAVSLKDPRGSMSFPPIDVASRLQDVEDQLCDVQRTVDQFIEKDKRFKDNINKKLDTLTDALYTLLDQNKRQTPSPALSRNRSHGQIPPAAPPPLPHQQSAESGLSVVSSASAPGVRPPLVPAGKQGGLGTGGGQARYKSQ